MTELMSAIFLIPAILILERKKTDMTKESTKEIVTAVEKINTGLQAFEERKVQFTQLAESAKVLDLPRTREALKDKPLIKSIIEKRKELKNLRVQTEKEGKAMRDMISPITKGIMEAQKELVSITEGEEERLQGIEDWIEQEKSVIQAEEEAKEQQMIQARVNRLFELGMTFNGTHYIFAERSIDTVAVSGLTDEVFEEFVSLVKQDAEKVEEEKKEKQRIEDLSKYRMDEMLKYGFVPEPNDPPLGEVPEDTYKALFEGQKDNWEQAEQKKKDDAIKLLQQENDLKRMKEELYLARKTSIVSLGYEESVNGEFMFHKFTGYKVYRETISEVTSDEWQKIMEGITKLIEDKKRFDERSMKLIEAGFLIWDNGFDYLDKITLNKEAVVNDTDEEFADRLAKLIEVIAGFKAEADRKAQQILEDAKKEAADAERKRIEDKQKAEEEKARLAAEKAERKAARRPDKEKIIAFSEVLSSLHIPELKTAEAKAVWTKIDQKIQQLHTFIIEQAEAL